MKIGDKVKIRPGVTHTDSNLAIEESSVMINMKKLNQDWCYVIDVHQNSCTVGVTLQSRNSVFLKTQLILLDSVGKINYWIL